LRGAQATKQSPQKTEIASLLLVARINLMPLHRRPVAVLTRAEAHGWTANGDWAALGDSPERGLVGKQQCNGRRSGLVWTSACERGGK
jgi:hypothetical protein